MCQEVKGRPSAFKSPLDSPLSFPCGLLSNVLQWSIFSCQPAWIWSHLGGTALSGTVGAFPERIDRGRKTHPECGQHHRLGRDHGLGMKEEKGTELHHSARNVTACYHSLSVPALPQKSASFFLKFIYLLFTYQFQFHFPPLCPLPQRG